MNTDNSEFSQKTENFLFFMKSNLATQFCCGCNLKLGIIIIAILKLVMYISQFSYMYGTSYIVTIYSLESVADIVSMGLLFYSTINRRVDFAYWGYFIVAVLLYFKAFCCILMTILLFSLMGYYSSYYQTSIYLYVIFVIIIFIITLALEYYYAYIIYSFTRYITLGNWNAVEGDFSGIDNNIKAQLNSQGNNTESSISVNAQNNQNNSFNNHDSGNYTGPQYPNQNQGNQQELVVQGEQAREVRVNNTGNSNQNVVSLDTGMTPMTNAIPSNSMNNK